MDQPAKVEHFRCAGCGADMAFDPESGGMRCPFCGRAESLPAAPAVAMAAHAFDDALGEPVQALSPQALEVNCASCGSAVVFEPPQVGGTCSFCGAAIVAQPKAADPLIAPDAVLPVKVPKNAAQAEVKQWLSSRWFAPNALKRMAQQEGIGGVYLPFWTYAAQTESQYEGERGEYYWVNESYTETDAQGNEVERTRSVRHTRWHPAAGQVSREFEDLLIAATRSVNEERLNKLAPWDLDALCPYEPAYLAGFKAQRYQVDLRQGFEKAKEVMAARIEEDVREDIGGDEQRIENIDTAYSHVMFRHLLLPVWIGAYRFQGQVYQVAVNARTGEVQGSRPYSAWKIIWLVVTILLWLALIAVLARR